MLEYLTLILACQLIGEFAVSTANIPFPGPVAGMILFAPQQNRLISLAPQQANLLLALNGSAIYLGMASGAALAGVLYADSGTDWLALVSAILVLLALIGGYLSERAVKQRG